MIVSSIAKFNAISNINNAAFNIMQNNSAMLGNLNAFSGSTSLECAHKNEMSLMFSNLKNRLLYMVSDAQLKNSDCDTCENKKSHFNAFA